MKLVARYEYLEQAEQAAMLLSAHGIVTHVTSTGIKSLRHIIHSDVDADLFVLIDEQYEDAKQLLDDPLHIVKTGLAASEFAELNNSAELQVSKILNIAIVCGIAIIIVMSVIMLSFGTAD